VRCDQKQKPSTFQAPQARRKPRYWP
jgi:hypothetical protein